MTDSFECLLQSLRDHKTLYLFDPKFGGIIDFLAGYEVAHQTLQQPCRLSDFQNWLCNKVGRHFSLHWGAYILQEMASGDEIAAEKILFDLLDEFIREKRE